MSLFKRAEQKVRAGSAKLDQVGFVGTADVARHVDWNKTPVNVQVRLYHAHDITGECKKNRGGPLCGK